MRVEGGGAADARPAQHDLIDQQGRQDDRQQHRDQRVEDHAGDDRQEDERQDAQELAVDDHQRVDAARQDLGHVRVGEAPAEREREADDEQQLAGELHGIGEHPQERKIA
jgi:hypothetical protein